MTTLYIVRHGETDWNTQGKFQGLEDIPLNETGRKQALLSTKYLNKQNCDVIVSSPLSRAKDTAEIIGKNIGIEKIEIVKDFIERDLGSASGLLPEERKKRFPDGFIADAEPKLELRKRVFKAMADLHNKYTNKKIIVVTHGGIINSIMQKLTDEKFNPNETKIFNGSVTVLRGNGIDWKLELFNYV